ncbi:MAG: hypothetical protein PHT36_02570 [Patescibacteria group bacterium]|nr:hypothetical protein [Patescibacteria group bacterium]
MAKENEKVKKQISVAKSCDCQKGVGAGFKWGLGFWLSAMLIWIIVSAIVAALYYYL